MPWQHYQSESGLSYNCNRDYGPLTGSYVESDPIGLKGGINTFAYVNDDPINFYDTTGLLCTYSQITVSVWQTHLPGNAAG
jgi:RHS repeat-associated protein